MDISHSSLQDIQFDLRPTVDYRLRIERRLDRDFNSLTNDDRSDALNRIRLGVAWKSGKDWSGEVQYQYAHDEIWRKTRTSSDEASDLSLAYFKYKKGDLEVTAGRQKINIGSERLIGSLDWSMTGRSFDGVRLKKGSWDAYAFKVGVAFPKPGRTRIAGVSYSGEYGLSSLIYKHDDQGAVINLWTLSHLWQVRRGKWSYDAEGAFQSGTVGGKRLTAWALHGSAAYQFNAKTRGFIEVNAASGGAGKTFDNLLPTNHKFYGSMDMQAWRNMEELAIGVDHQLSSKWNGKAHLHSFSLRDASDAWYGAGGGANAGFLDPTGGSGRDVGRELDIEFSYKHDARLTFTGGIGIFWPGGFVKARNGGNANAQYWGFIGAQYRF